MSFEIVPKFITFELIVICALMKTGFLVDNYEIVQFSSLQKSLSKQGQ